MPPRIANRVAFITGASTGIGQATAIRLATDGYDIAMAGVTPGSLRETEENLEALGVRTASLYFDVGNADDTNSAFNEAVARLGGIDVLVNNAAVPLLRPAIDVSAAEWDFLMNANLKGAFFLSQTMARQLRDAGRPGNIVNVASTHGIVALKDRSTYGIAKAAMIHMTRCLAVEWADLGIRVNCVAPATISTPSREASLADPDKRKFMIGRIPLGRFGLSAEVAAAIAYLASEGAGFTTGQTLTLDGGLTAI